MKKLIRHPVIFLLLLVSLVTASVTCGAEVHDVSAGATHLQSDPAADSPCCPDDHETDTPHCDSCLSCPCHAPLAVQSLQAGYAPAISQLCTFETCPQLTEVYLPIFVPPQNPA